MTKESVALSVYHETIPDSEPLTPTERALLRFNPCQDCDHAEREHGSGYLRYSCRADGCDCPSHVRTPEVQGLMDREAFLRWREKSDAAFAEALARVMALALERPERLRAVEARLAEALAVGA